MCAGALRTRERTRVLTQLRLCEGSHVCVCVRACACVSARARACVCEHPHVRALVGACVFACAREAVHVYVCACGRACGCACVCELSYTRVCVSVADVQRQSPNYHRCYIFIVT